MVPLHVTTGGAELSDMASKGRYHEDVFGVMISAKAAQQTRVNLASKKAELLELAALVRSCDTAGTTLSLSHGVCARPHASAALHAARGCSCCAACYVCMQLLCCMLCAHAAAVLHAGMSAQACIASYALDQSPLCCYCANALPFRFQDGALPSSLDKRQTCKIIVCEVS